MPDGPDPLAALLERAEPYIYLATALILVAAAAAPRSCICWTARCWC